jgi:hypothetical protein
MYQVIRLIFIILFCGGVNAQEAVELGPPIKINVRENTSEYDTIKYKATIIEPERLIWKTGFSVNKYKFTFFRPQLFLGLGTLTVDGYKSVGISQAFDGMSITLIEDTLIYNGKFYNLGKFKNVILIKDNKLFSESIRLQEIPMPKNFENALSLMERIDITLSLTFGDVKIKTHSMHASLGREAALHFKNTNLSFYNLGPFAGRIVNEHFFLWGKDYGKVKQDVVLDIRDNSVTIDGTKKDIIK